MKRYAVDIKLIGYETVHVEAENEDEAIDKANDRFWEIYNQAPAKNLRWKETTADILGVSEET